MRRGARLALYGGIVVAVVGLSLYHARVIADPPYSYTGTFRFGWSLLYIGVLMVTAYGLGLPDLPRTAGPGARGRRSWPPPAAPSSCRCSSSSAATPSSRGSSSSGRPSCWCPGTCSARRWLPVAGNGRRTATGCSWWPRSRRSRRCAVTCAAPPSTTPPSCRSCSRPMPASPRASRPRTDRSSRRRSSTGRPWSCSTGTQRRTTPIVDQAAELHSQGTAGAELLAVRRPVVGQGAAVRARAGVAALRRRARCTGRGTAG